jgi:hypothetical protein
MRIETLPPTTRCGHAAARAGSSFARDQGDDSTFDVAVKPIQFFDQERHFVLDDIPQDVRIDAEVGMSNPVAHTNDCIPRHGR